MYGLAFIHVEILDVLVLLVIKTNIVTKINGRF